MVKCKNFESLTLPALAVAAEENPEEITGSLRFLNGRTGGRDDFAITARGLSLQWREPPGGFPPFFSLHLSY